MPDGWTHAIASVVGLLIVVFAHMVLGEMVPKNFTLTHPEATLRVISLPNRAYLTVAGPVVKVLNAMANVGVRLCGVEPRDELASAHTAEELALMVAASREEGTIQGFAAELLSGVLDFGGREVASVMVPRERDLFDRRHGHRGRRRGGRARPGPLPPAGGRARRDRRRARASSTPRTSCSSPRSPSTGRCRPACCAGCWWCPGSDRSRTCCSPCAGRGCTSRSSPNPTAPPPGIVTLDDLLSELVGDITDEPDQP